MTKSVRSKEDRDKAIENWMNEILKMKFPVSKADKALAKEQVNSGVFRVFANMTIDMVLTKIYELGKQEGGSYQQGIAQGRKEEREEIVKKVIKWMASRFIAFNDKWEAWTYNEKETKEHFIWAMGGDITSLTDECLTHLSNEKEEHDNR
jgi:hypothetical protein